METPYLYTHTAFTVVGEAISAFSCSGIRVGVFYGVRNRDYDFLYSRIQGKVVLCQQNKRNCNQEQNTRKKYRLL